MCLSGSFLTAVSRDNNKVHICATDVSEEFEYSIMPGREGFIT